MGGAQSVDRDLAGFDLAAGEHIDILLTQQVPVCNDPRGIPGSFFLCQGHQPFRKVFDHVCGQQRLASEPGDTEVLSAGNIQHSARECHYVILYGLAHLSGPVAFKAIRTVKVAVHGRTDGETNAMRCGAGRASHCFQRGKLVHSRDDTALCETFDDRVMLIQPVQNAQQVELQW